MLISRTRGVAQILVNLACSFKIKLIPTVTIPVESAKELAWAASCAKVQVHEIRRSNLLEVGKSSRRCHTSKEPEVANKQRVNIEFVLHRFRGVCEVAQGELGAQADHQSRTHIEQKRMSCNKRVTKISDSKRRKSEIRECTLFITLDIASKNTNTIHVEECICMIIRVAICVVREECSLCHLWACQHS